MKNSTAAKDTDQNIWQKSSILLQSSLLGIWRGLIGLPFEHPFDTIKTNMQTYQTKFLSTYKNIYQKHGWYGFYSGFLVNSMRIASKQIYRWPMTIGLFSLYENYFEDRATLGIASGVSMAVVQTGFLCPFERLKVWLMTASRQSSMRQFFKQFQYKALFDGMLPVFVKQVVSWVTFLGATEYFKDLAYKHAGKDRYQSQLNTTQVLIISAMVAIVNTLFVMPVDCIKTNFQKNTNIIQPQKQQYKIQQNQYKFRRITRQIFQRHGLRGFYIGFEVKLIQYTINSLFTVVLFEKLLKDYELSVKKSKKQVQ